MEQRPMHPPADSQPPPPPPPSSSCDDPLKNYHRVADTVGGLPNLRWRDNLIQGLFVLVVTILAAAVGYGVGGGPGLLFGLFLGLLGSCLLSGVVLMVLGWIRAFRK